MSTRIKQVTRFPVVFKRELSRHRSLRMLVTKLAKLRTVPTLNELYIWLRETRTTDEDLRPYRSFKRSTYTRYRIFRNEFTELLVLCWRPGQRTPIHDHDGSYGAVRVCEGMLWETTFGLNGSREPYYQSARTWHVGQVTGADAPDIHQLGNPEASNRNLVTLHLYAPPLGVINTYKLGSPFVEHYSPTESEEGIIKDFVDPYLAHIEKI